MIRSSMFSTGRVTRLVAALMFLQSSCTYHDTSFCTMKEAVVSDAGQIISKEVFVHDGSNYVEVQEFRYDDLAQKFNETPNYITTLTYANGRVVSAVRRAVGGPDESQQSYAYTTSGDITNVSIHLAVLYNGNVTAETTHEEHFIEKPSDTTYLTKDPLGTTTIEQYRNGNLMNVGVQADTGTFAAFDTTWAFTLRYHYDNKPNAATDYVLLDLITNIPNWGYCTNNVTELFIGNIPDPQKQTFFLGQNNRLEKYVYEGTGRTVTITYNCK